MLFRSDTEHYFSTFVLLIEWDIMSVGRLNINLATNGKLFLLNKFKFLVVIVSIILVDRSIDSMIEHPFGGVLSFL